MELLIRIRAEVAFNMPLLGARRCLKRFPYVLIHWILAATVLTMILMVLQMGKLEVKRGQVTCLWTDSWQIAWPGFKPRQASSRVYTPNPWTLLFLLREKEGLWGGLWR